MRERRNADAETSACRWRPSSRSSPASSWCPTSPFDAAGHGRYRLAGKVTAQLTQNCVVTLDPIAQNVEGSFDVQFWPPGKLPESGEEEVEALNAAEIEPIEHGRIDAGRIVFETLSASVDPYPRKPGAALAGR